MEGKIRAVLGGTSASKTISILMDLIDRAQNDKNPTITSVVSESLPHLKKGCIRDFQNIMKSHGRWIFSHWNQTDKIYTFGNGSQIEFFGADQPEKLRGGRRDRGFINEANNVSLETFDEFEVRTREFVFLDWNPTNEFWYYTDVKPLRSDIEEIVLTYKDNEYLDEGTVKSIEQRKNRADWWKVYGLGQLGELVGKIFSNWAFIDEIPHEAKLAGIGLDFGYTNDPTAIVAVYYYNGGYIVDEIAYSKGMSNNMIADVLKNSPKALITADSAEPKSIDEIYAHGVNIIGVSKKGKEDNFVKWSINSVQDQRISVTKRSVNIIKEYRSYLWMVDKNGKPLNQPEHEYSHAMDAIRYAFVSILSGHKTNDEFAENYLKNNFLKDNFMSGMSPAQNLGRDEDLWGQTKKEKSQQFGFLR